VCILFTARQHFRHVQIFKLDGAIIAFGSRSLRCCVVFYNYFMFRELVFRHAMFNYYTARWR